MTLNTTGDYINIGDAKLYYERAGSGETLVFCHAGVTDSRMWDDQWQALSAHYDVVRFDMRGFGQSDVATVPVCRREDLDKFLTQLGLNRVHLVGCSLGGEIVIDYTLEHPDKVQSLTVISAVPSGFEMQGEPPAYLFEMMAAAQQGDIARASELQNRIWADGPYRQPEQVNADFRRRVGAMNIIALQNQTFALVEMQPLNPLNPPAVQRLGEIKQPTLIIAGALDNTEILRAAEVMDQQIANTKKVILPESAHLTNMEQPDLFNMALLNFLQSVPSAV